MFSLKLILINNHKQTNNLTKLEIEGKEFEVDGDGFLKQPDLWDEEVAFRKNWEETDMAPMIRKICQHTGIRLREIYELFPMGPAKGACKIAGLPKPDGCV
jgi:tRNA 2-thiouridine synthesizing protein E